MSEQDNEAVAVDTSTEVEETTNSSESSEQENTVDLAEVEELRKAKSQLTARAKKAEEELKSLKANPPIKSDPQLSDELKLIARGLSDEEIEQAKVIAKGKGIVLTEAIKDPLFVIFQSDLKEKERKENAKLGASKGSGESRDETLIKPEMTRDEHEKAFKKVMGL
ncbi:hypothetical protein M0R04_14120 [Candidatus Dojkabacteria bacterium]|jgi:hypothetical protein|nr:hypothetical protein [Candidatus Dojkabacteria bacterium]